MELRENERIDDLSRRGYQIIQNKTRFCFGVDAVLLAWFSKVNEGENVLDLCTGTGIVPILMDARYDRGDYTGLEISSEMVEMANRSVLLNQIEDHMKIIEGDVCKASEIFKKSSFDVITVNPPYMAVHHGLQNPDYLKAIARHEILCTLDDVIRESAMLLRPSGRFYMVHRPVRIPAILEKMKEYKIAPSRMILVHPYEDKDATMVLISGTKNGKDLLKVEAPIVIYSAPNVRTEKVEEIYRE